MATDNKKALVYSIMEFLEKSCKDGSVKEDSVEGIEVAIQCLGEAFDVDPTDAEQQKQYSTKPATLQNIFDVYLKTKSNKKQPLPSLLLPPLHKEVSEDDKKTAEDLKVQGNRKVAERNYPEAIRLYSEAISHNPNNAVFYGNRAAAYSQQGNHEQAIEDSKTAIELDPSYSKAYSRMGHAHFSLGKYDDAITAYEKGLELDPSNATLKSSIDAARGKLNASSVERSASPPSGGAGGGFPGGMPDLAGLLNNPAMMNMAQQMMQSGAFNDLMQNPEMMSNMARQFMGGNGGGLSEMMQNPELMDRARQFMDGMGGANGGGNAGSNNNNNDQ
ncbi:unnamed protein product [Umbelopsis ramanniana]